MMKDAKYFIDKIGMLPHPEGGFYKETYRSTNEIANAEGNLRSISTPINFLLENNNKSHFHKIKSDELWFHHEGETLEILSIQNGELIRIFLGNNLENGEVLHTTIPANIWFASRMKNYQGFGLVSCTVAPGFDFADFEMSKKNELANEFPHLKDIIEEMTLE
ncbi:MAG: cupin domain-containing protein [Bacteroidetes bacterium]|nr:cupin domain-containing protein [Bacteroidota bacterium]MBU1759456.1 cupin domain-containing protein [Bacteroidota bacterium]